MPTSAVFFSSSASATSTTSPGGAHAAARELGEGDRARRHLALHVGGAAADQHAVALDALERADASSRSGGAGTTSVWPSSISRRPVAARDPGDQVESLGVGADELEPRRPAARR